MDAELFPSAFFELLQRDAFFSLEARQAVLGGMFCQRHRAGDSQDFFDYRAYSPGDDIRFMDWNIYHRCRKLFVKKYTAMPKDAQVISLDVSKSMTFSSVRAVTAWRTAAWLAAKLLRCGETVQLRVSGVSHDFCGISKDMVTLVCEFLSEAYGHRAQGQAPEYGLKTARRHWVISDFYEGASLETWADMLKTWDCIPIRIVDEDEEHPTFRGAISLTDAETGQVVTVDVDEEALRRYQDNLRMFDGALETLARRHGLPLLKVRSCLDIRALFEGLEGNLGRETR